MTMDYRLLRLIKPGFYWLIPAKKLRPAPSDTSYKLEQGGVFLPAKLLVSVTLSYYWWRTVAVRPATLTVVHLRSSEVSGPILPTVPTIILMDFCCDYHSSWYYSWKPDPAARAVDGFSGPWAQDKPYLFLPFNLIERALTKIQIEVTEFACLKAPAWPTQVWYLQLLKLLVRIQSSFL